MKTAEIRELTDEELAQAVDQHRRELFNLRLQAQTGQLENSARITMTRRDVARLKTEMGARAQQSKA